ncbi:MAG: metal-dependent hydrolase [Cytophagales bacterium]|nr:metal-dependent hydrolase [Cytophaga sp.]
MDILIHTLSGTATAACIAACAHTATRNRARLILTGGFAAAFPDIDAFSLWSKFDSTIGKWLGLSASGHDIYFGKRWYSHHGFFHSILAAVFVALCYLLIRKLWHRKEAFTSYSSSSLTKITFAVFFCAYLSHLAGDLPTPGGPWDGIRLFFPFSVYVGGWGYIWWWNNYDVFLCLLATNILLITGIFLIPVRFNTFLKRAVLVVYITGCILICYSIGNRKEDFAYSGNTLRYNYYEKVSMQEQFRILGPPLYRYLLKTDRRLPIHF